VSNVERIEFYTMPFCDSCDLALHDVLPVAKEKKIPVHVLPVLNSESIVVPYACVIKKADGVEKKQCIRGYDSNYSKDLIKILEED